MIKLKPANAPSLSNILNEAMFLHRLNIFGMILIAVSVLYLLAANWWMLPRALQLAIPQILLIFSAGASVLFVKSEAVIQTLHGICGLMIGLSLAVIGQVYQTGADSYLLFLLWTVLLLPWLYRRNSGITVLIIITGCITLMLASNQLGYPEWQLMIALQIWLAVLWLFIQRLYLGLDKYITLLICMVSVMSMLFYFGDHDYAYVFLLCAFTLPLLTAYWNYRKNNALALSMLMAGIGINLLIWLSYGVLDKLDLGTAGLLLLVLISLAIFGLLSKIILSFFPQTKFGFIPLFIGAWLSGLLLMAFVAAFFHSAAGILCSAAVALAAALFVLRRPNPSYFLRQLWYCLLIFAQAGLYGGILGLTKSPSLAMLVMPPLIAICYGMRLSSALLALQLLSFYGMLLLSLSFAVYENQVSHGAFSWLWPLMHFAIYAFIPLMLQRIDEKYRTALMLSGLMMILVGQGMLLMQLSFFSGFLDRGFGLPAWAEALLFAGWWIIFYMVYAKRLPYVELALWLLFSAALLVLGYFEIFLCLLVWAWSLSNRNSAVQLVSMLVLIALLWMLYYSLNVSFLQKSMSIFLSGLVVLAMGSVLQLRYERVSA